MLQRTKKFFKRSIQSVKSYFSEGYEKLPKAPSYNGHHNGGFSLENIYSDFADQWEAKDHIMAITYEKDKSNLKHEKPSMLINYHEVDRRKQQKHKETVSSETEEKRRFVTRTLKNMVIMDKDNVDHVNDIQEILHFYSRLTSPVYREMVENLFMEMYSEVFSLRLPNNSTPQRLSIQV